MQVDRQVPEFGRVPGPQDCEIEQDGWSALHRERGDEEHAAGCHGGTDRVEQRLEPGLGVQGPGDPRSVTVGGLQHGVASPVRNSPRHRHEGAVAMAVECLHPSPLDVGSQVTGEGDRALRRTVGPPEDLGTDCPEDVPGTVEGDEEVRGDGMSPTEPTLRDRVEANPLGVPHGVGGPSLRRVLEDVAGELAGLLGRVDGAREAVAHQLGDQAAVIDVRVGEDDRSQTPRLEWPAALVPGVVAGEALLAEPAVDQELGALVLKVVAGAGHTTDGSDEADAHR